MNKTTADRLRELIEVYAAAKTFIEEPDQASYEILVIAVKGATPAGMKVSAVAASSLGSIKSERKARASRANGKLGGRPKIKTKKII